MPYRTKVDPSDPERRIAETWKADAMARRRDPHSHPPTKPERMDKVKIDNVMPRLQARLAAGHENPVRVSSGGEDEWPVDLPVRIDVHRVLGKFKHDLAGPALGLMGHVIDFDFYSQSTRIVIKSFLYPLGIAVFVNEEEVYRRIEDDGRERLEDIPDSELPGMWERSDFTGGADSIEEDGIVWE